jgi:4-hydroxyacetophenone monooxygenase
MTVRDELLAATDETIDDATAYADPMILRGLMYQLTGDAEVAATKVEGAMIAGRFSNRVADEADHALLRRKAADFLKAYRDQGAGEISVGPAERLFQSMEMTAGVELQDVDRPIWMQQTALDPWERGLKWKREPATEKRAAFKVGVIGSGLSGLNAAVHLKRAGIPFVVIEKNREVGGTWFENRYPGARVDSPSRSYLHKFGTGFDYPYAYCPQEENLKYMQWVSTNFGVRDRILFNTEVTSMTWLEDEQVWEVKAKGPSGEQVWKFNAVISCVGFLSRPQMPTIKGMETFKGTACHSAMWPDGLDVAGKRVAVIGSGASGYQTVPVMAKTANHVTLFQRTPSWCFDNPIYVSKLPVQIPWLERNLPYYVNFVRMRIAAQSDPNTVRLAVSADPDFNDPDARSARNKFIRDERIAFIKRKFESRPELIEKMIPPAPPYSSRPLMVDAKDSVYDALLRDNVTLVSDPIETITPTGIRAGGVDHAFDIIVYATGFKANDFLWPMVVRGRGGQQVEELWAKDGPRAYLGSMLPGFPNLFMGYGPNTNNFGGFQVIDLLEMTIKFALQCIAELITEEKSSVEVTEDAYWTYNAEVDREEKMMLYMDRRVKNYYRNEHDRSCVNGPIDFRRMWRWLHDPNAPIPKEATDAGVRPYFGEDITVA